MTQLTLRAAATPTQQQQADAILSNLKNQLIQDGLSDVADAVIPELQKIEQAPNAGVAIAQFAMIQAGLLASLPTLETQALQQVSAAAIAIFRVYVPVSAAA